MNGTLAGMVDLVRDGLGVGFVVFLRVGALMALLPAFGEQSVPVRVRLALTIAFTLIVMPAVAADVAPLAATAPVRLLATEVMAGLVLGLGLRIFVMALQIAGTMAAQASSLSQFFGGAGVDPQPAMAQVLLIGGLALAVMAGFHVRVASALIQSYEVLPAGVFAPAAMLAEWGLSQVTRAFALAFSLAAPFTIASLIYNVALGVINRAMPQLMVAFIGAPALTAGGLAMLFLAVPVVLAVWMQAFDLFLADPFRATP